MRRRAFLKTTAAAAGLASAGVATQSAPAADKAAGSNRSYFEIRSYTLSTPEKKVLLDAYLRDGAIPALNRAGIRTVGVFSEEKPSPKPVVYVVLPYASLDQLAAASQVLSDEVLQKSAADYLGTPATDPVFERIESWLTQAFEGMPKMDVPTKGNQVYQLRIYESHGEKAGKKKIEMFNIGEIAIFKRVGLVPVFFGETILGPRMPNLTYMLTFRDQAAKDQAWGTFRQDAEWTKLKGTPGFSDKEIVSHITNITLVPAPYSQI